MTEPKYDAATLAQLATIAAQAIATKAQEAADKNAKDIEELKKQLSHAFELVTATNKIMDGVREMLVMEMAQIRNEMDRLRDDHNELAVEVRGLGKQDAKKTSILVKTDYGVRDPLKEIIDTELDKEVSLLEFIRNLFKRK